MKKLAVTLLLSLCATSVAADIPLLVKSAGALPGEFQSSSVLTTATSRAESTGFPMCIGKPDSSARCRSSLLANAVCLVMSASSVVAQTVRAIPRPPAQAPGPPKPEDGKSGKTMKLALYFLLSLALIVAGSLAWTTMLLHG